VNVQPALPLDWPVDDGDAEFIVTGSNRVAVAHLERSATWPVFITLLTGPRKSGRSLLGRVFGRRSGGRVIDDADRADERTLFSAWNEAQARRQPLLLIAEVAPPAWKIALPDLASRLSATPTVTLGPPDDDLIGRLLAKQLERRGLDLTLEVRAYLIPRSPRSPHGVIALADALDTASLARRRAVTIPLAREVLGPIDGHGEGG
jgi:chromosomal replication initiation ATPase DnaA